MHTSEEAKESVGKVREAMIKLADLYSPAFPTSKSASKNPLTLATKVDEETT
jgi:hypothetical protein